MKYNSEEAMEVREDMRKFFSKSLDKVSFFELFGIIDYLKNSFEIILFETEREVKKEHYKQCHKTKLKTNGQKVSRKRESN